MREEKRLGKQHPVHVLFPMGLMVLFAVTALCVVLVAAGFYKTTREAARENDNIRIAVSYIRERVKGNDAVNEIYLDTWQGIDCLCFLEEDNPQYVTRIYFQDDSLRELSAARDAKVKPEDGTAIASLLEFSMEYLENGLLQVCCVDAYGNQEKLLIHTKSSTGEAL